MQYEENLTSKEKDEDMTHERESEQKEGTGQVTGIDDHSPININYHAAFLGGLKILLWAYREQLEILPEQWISTQGLRMDVLILKKDPSITIDYDITRIFREHNILEYKRNDDELTVDVFAKVMAYAHLYKSQGKTVDAIPYNEISATIYRHAYPREAFKKLEELGAVIEEKYPGVYYVKGDYPFFPVQVLVGRKLNPKEYAMFRVLIPGAKDEDILTFKNIAVQNRAEAYQRNVDAIFQASVSANRETYDRLKKEDPDMYEALKDLMKDDFAASEAKGESRGVKKGETNKITEQVRKKIVKNKSFDQIVDECESTPEEITPIYNQLLAEFQN